MVVGCLGDIVFTVSSEVVETLNNMRWSGSARYAVHDRHGTNALTEFTGIDPDKFSFDIELSGYLGINPMAEMVKIWNYERSGEAVPLVIGTKAYGKYRWNVVSHTIQSKSFDGEGDLASATVNISLQEYLRN